MANTKTNALEVGKAYTLYVHNVNQGNKGQGATIDVKTTKGDKRSQTVPVDDTRLPFPLEKLRRQQVEFICREEDGKPRLFLADKYYNKPEAVQAEAEIESVLNPTVPAQCIYEPGKEYKMSVFYCPPERNRFSVQEKDGKIFDVQIVEKLRKPLRTGCPVTLKCTGVKDGVPSFELPPSYYLMKIGVGEEGPKVEFKSSIIFSPESHQPDASQPLQIAREIAAFANSDGGTLYLGVRDDGVVSGIEEDLKHLEEAEVKNGSYTDKDYTYHKNRDGFALKLHALIRFYLGELADSLVEGPEFKNAEGGDGDCTYAILNVQPSESIIYCGEREEVFYRSDSSSVILKGRGRDEYIRKRFYDSTTQDYSQLMQQFKESQEAGQQEMNAKLQELVEALKTGKLGPSSQIAGTRVSVLPETALRLSDPDFLTFKGKIKRAIYQMNTPRQLTEPATTWKAFYEAVLRILAKLDPEKFKTLPEVFQPTRRAAAPFFTRRGDGRRLSESSDYLGQDKDIRANLSVGSRASFRDPKSVPARVLAFFGVKPEDLAVEIEK